MTEEEQIQLEEEGKQAEQSSTLEELCENLKRIQENIDLDINGNIYTFYIGDFVDMDRLPTFGGHTPMNKGDVYSWNKTHVLTLGSQWQLEEREDL